VSNEGDTTNDVIESGVTQATRENDVEPQTTPNPPDLPRKRQQKSDWEEPLNPPEDEAIAQHRSRFGNSGPSASLPSISRSLE
jgi:hypothetical protein